MNIKTGDKVKFLNETGEGQITGFQDQNVALVTMDDGFEIPMRISELIKVENGDREKNDNNSLQETVATKNEPNSKSQTLIRFKSKDGIYLAIVKIKFDSYNLVLINDTNYMLLYTVSTLDEDKANYIISGELEDNTKIILNTYTSDIITNIGSIVFQGIIYGTSGYEIKDPVQKIIELENKFLSDSLFKENSYFEERAYIIKLENNDMAKEIEKLKKSDIQAIIKTKDPKPVAVGDFLKQKKKNNPGNDTEEIDLHIESIVDDHSSLSPGEIINMQLSRFEISLTGAIKNKQRRIIFIHGVGNGKLKYEMQKILERKYPDCQFQDASFKEYGYGAMMVILK